jgi:hypothetical protein
MMEILVLMAAGKGADQGWVVYLEALQVVMLAVLMVEEG